MEQPNLDQQTDLLYQAEDMLRELQAGNEEKVSGLLEKLKAARETCMFQEVGKMTRQLHDALESFRNDARLDSLTHEDIPNARARLSHVITMTQQSAEKTLAAVEESMPIADKIAKGAGELNQTWKRFRRRELSAEQFRDLSAAIEKFLEEIENDSTLVRTNLNNVLMAQDFQDLTGQIITRVIDLVEEVEGNLVDLIRITGSKMLSARDESEKNIKAEGPQVPGIDGPDVMANQDDVDDLLSSLGF